MMLTKKALKTELASAALAIGIMGAAPAFAQDTDSVINDNNIITAEETLETETTVPQEQQWTIDPYNPEIPEGVLWALAILAAGVTLNAARNKMEGAWLRAGAMGVAAAVLVNPEMVVQEYEGLPTEVLIMIDKSASQDLDGRGILTSSASEQLEQSLSALGNVRTTIVEFGEDEANAVDGTNLQTALQSGLNIIPSSQLGAVFILSDGQVHDAQTVLNTLGIDAPVHSLISGEEGERDFYIQIEDAPRYGMAGEDVPFSFSVQGGLDGDAQDYSFSVTMSVNGETIATETARLNEVGSFPLAELPAGENNVEISIARINEIESGESITLDEITLKNNHVTTTIQGIQDDLNVLLISGAPHQGTRHLREMLGSDPDVNFVHFAYLRPPGKEDETPLRYLATTAFPVHEVLNENIEDYDVIIFDNYTYNGIIPLSYFHNIENWVENGGALMISGGDDLAAPNSLSVTPLGDILPLHPTGQTFEQAFRPQISETGERHPLSRGIQYSFSQSQDWGSWYDIAGANASEGANVLMSDESGHPLLALSEHGEGRVAMLSSDQSWLWARGHQGGGPANELTRNLTRWLVKNPSMEAEDVRLTRQGERLMVELQTMSDESEDIVITSPSGEQITVTPEEYRPGLRRAFIPASELGVYKAARAGDNPDFAFAEVGLEDPTEMRNVVSTEEILRPLSEAHNGQVARMNDMPQVLRFADLTEDNQGAMGVQLSEDQQLSGTKRSPIVPQWLALMLSLGMFAYAMKREGGKTIKETLLGNRANKSKPDQPSAPELDI